MTTDVPVPMRVRHVATGDEFVSSHDGSHWRITSAPPELWYVKGREITAEREGQEVASGIDPDHVLEVLVPADECDAVELCRDVLGARLAGRRVT